MRYSIVYEGRREQVEKEFNVDMTKSPMMYGHVLFETIRETVDNVEVEVVQIRTPELYKLDKNTKKLQKLLPYDAVHAVDDMSANTKRAIKEVMALVPSYYCGY